MSDSVFTGIYGPSSSNVYPSTSVVLPNIERSAAFVTKVDSNGSVKWGAYINNVVTRLIEQSVNITSTGNVYASGTYGKYRSNVYNSDGTKFDGYLPQLGDQGVYLVKYDTSGFAYWQTYIDDVSTNEYNYSITNKYSNLYITGSSANYGFASVKAYNAKTTGDRLPTDSGFSTSNRMFAVKYNNNGQAQWMTSVNGGASDYAPSPGDICTDSNENVLCTFNFYNSGSTGQFVQSNGTTFSPTFRGGSVIKMNQGGMGVLGFYIENCPVIRGVCTSPIDNSIYVCGRMPSGGTPLNFYQWNGTTIVNSGASLNPTRSSAVQGFIAKYSSSGIYQWSAYIIHPSNGDGEIFGYSVGCDSAGNVYMAGEYENYTQESVVYSSDGSAFPTVLPGVGFGGGFGDAYTGGYLVKFNSSGICQWVVRLDTGNIRSYPNMSIDSVYDVITVTSQYYGRNVKFYDSNGGEHNSLQLDEVSSQFIAYCVKYDTNGFLVSV